jgi:hypothetical protein
MELWLDFLALDVLCLDENYCCRNSNNYKTSFCSVVEVYKGVSADDFQGNIYAREGSPMDN